MNDLLWRSRPFYRRVRSAWDLFERVAMPRRSILIFAGACIAIAAALAREVLAVDMSEAATTVCSSSLEKRLPLGLSPDVPATPRR